MKWELRRGRTRLLGPETELVDEAGPRIGAIMLGGEENFRGH